MAKKIDAWMAKDGSLHLSMADADKHDYRERRKQATMSLRTNVIFRFQNIAGPTKQQEQNIFLGALFDDDWLPGILERLGYALEENSNMVDLAPISERCPTNEVQKGPIETEEKERPVPYNSDKE